VVPGGDLDVQKWFQEVTSTSRRGQTTIAVDEPVTFDWSGTGNPETRYFTFVCQPLLSAKGAVEGSVFFAIDVTANPERGYRPRVGERTSRLCLIASPRLSPSWRPKNGASSSATRPRAD
jgi:hypothetical protein